MFESPVLKILEVLLLAAVLYHGFDGIRLIIVHYFDVTDYRKSLFYAAFAASALLTIVGGIPLVLYALGMI
jgi:succinate dehydrogenase / fumarate reductase cytochrome b subunit